MKKMKKEKNAWKPITVIAVVLTVLAIAMVGTATAKSLYVNKDINANSPISAYDIQPAPTYLVWQQTSSPTRYGGVGLTIDTDSEILFVTFEGSGTLDIVDAKTLNLLGQVTAPDASNLAGIVVDHDLQKVYTNNREANSIYVYSWDATTKILTLDGTQTLTGVSKLYGIALDEVNDKLYVGDYTTTVKIFNTADWSSAGCFSVSQSVQGIAIDVPNQLVYTGNALGSGLLCSYDVNTNTETTVNIRTLPGAVSDDNVVGLAVDQDTSLLYATTGNQFGTGSDRILVFDSNLNLLYSIGDIGNPTGICVPGKGISYNPLNLTKDDGLDEDECVAAGGTITYDICYDNTANAFDVHNVTITDALPANTTFVSATGSYTIVGNTVTWNIGTLPAGAPQACVQLVVTVNPATAPETTIRNCCTIVGAEPGTGPTTVCEDTVTCKQDPLWQDINEELDELIAKVNAAVITPDPIKTRLVNNLKRAKAFKERAKEAHEAGDNGLAKKYLKRSKRQVESFSDRVKITDGISQANKDEFLEEAAKIKEKIDNLIGKL